VRTGASMASAGEDWKRPSGGWGARTGKKNRVAYNSHVQQDRLNKFYDRKKVHSKYKRAVRFEERNQATDGGSGKKSSILSQVLQHGASGLEEEYERRLSLSYGGGPVEADVAAPRKKKRRRQSVADDMEGESAPAKVEDPPQLSTLRARRKKARLADAADPVSAPEDAKMEAEVKSAPANEDIKQKADQPKMKKGSMRLPDRFSKDLKDFNDEREAQAQERQRRLDEELARKRQRHETSKRRAIKGQLVTQRTAWGQPKLHNILEAVTAKLAGEHHKPGQKQTAMSSMGRCRPTGKTRSR